MSTFLRRLGKYELQELLGRGGMAEVWKAFDTQLERSVAIKILQADLRTDPDFVNRFIREARTVAALHHPNIVQIYDFHVAEGGQEGSSQMDMIAYMVMDYVKGQTLSHYLQKTSRQKLFPPPVDIVRLFTPISLALDYAHEQGMIHRDIKPANILLDIRHTARNAMGEPILSDFGLAKVQGMGAQTVSGTVFGTPLYISPEQVQNLPVSARSDLYSLGIVLYEVFTGTPPFRADSLMSIMMMHLTEAPKAAHLLNPALPPALSSVLSKCIAKDPLQRYASAAEMVIAIAQAFDLPVQQELQQAAASTKDVEATIYGVSPLSFTPASNVLSSAAQAGLVEVDAAQTATPSHASLISSGDYAPVSDATVRATTETGPVDLSRADVQKIVQAETVRSPIVELPSAKLPESNTPQSLHTQPVSALSTPDTRNIDNVEAVVESHLPDEQHTVVAATTSGTMPPAPPVSSPGTMPSSPAQAPKRRGLYIVLVAIVVCVLVASGLTSFLLFAHHSPTTLTASVGANTLVGQAFFVSSGKTNGNTNQGLNDEFEINLHNIPNPQSGKSYYAWLLPAASQSEAAPIFLGTLHPMNGAIHFLYPGDSQHTNLLAITSRFLITEQAANLTIDIPSPDTSTWRYYAALPNTIPAGQTYSLLDHLRHLLAADPELDKLNLHGGVANWTYKNIQKVLDKAELAQADWKNNNFTDLHQQLVVILDYLDGATSVQQDVPTGTPIMANPQESQIGLLQLNTNPQAPMSYLYHIDLHLNGVLNSPGATQYQRQIASHIYSEINNLNGWLQQVRHDAVQLVQMNDTQLAQQSSLTLLNDLVTQANYAFMGQANASNQLDRVGIKQTYVNIQKLATFDVKPY